MKKLLVAALLGMGLSASAQADLFGFSCISNNSAADCLIGEAQLSMDVTALGINQVRFLFANAGPAASSITDIYFDFGLQPDSLTSIAGLTPSAGVSFAIGASPPNLPAGGPISFTADRSADSTNPTQPNGINPGETLAIDFNLASGFSFADVLNELNGQAPPNSPAASALRVGLHVQGFASGGSESFVNEGGGGGQDVPEPATLALLGLALAGLGAMRRRFA